MDTIESNPEVAYSVQLDRYEYFDDAKISGAFKPRFCFF